MGSPRSFPPNADEAATALADAVATERDVIAAWLFGSVARGTAGPLSDIDVALAFAGGEYPEAVCGRVIDALARRLRTGGIDLVVFDRTSIPLRARIIREGRRVVCRDRRACERLAVDAVMRDLDFRPVRDGAFRVQRHAILEGR
jgi:predicted nucleotidyltransferase